MIAFLSLAVAFAGAMAFWVSPFTGLVLIVLGVAIGEGRTRYDGELPEMLMFYAATAGCLVVMFG